MPRLSNRPASGPKIRDALRRLKDQAKDTSVWPNSDNSKVGPGLRGLFGATHKHPGASGKVHTSEDIRRLIENGSSSMSAMKQYLSETEIEDILAYLQTV